MFRNKAKPAHHTKVKKSFARHHHTKRAPVPHKSTTITPQRRTIFSVTTVTPSANLPTRIYTPIQHSRQTLLPVAFSTHCLFSTTTEPVTDVPHTITLPTVLADLQLEALIPSMQSPPELTSLVTQTGSPVTEITLYHLTILSAADFRALVPNDISRNRLKDHVRHLIHAPLVSDGAEPITKEQFDVILANFAKESAPASVAAAPATSPNSVTAAVDAPMTPSAETNPIEPVAEPALEATVIAEKELAKATLSSSMTSLNMPSFFDNMTEGTILHWHVKVNEHFARGHVLCDIDTDIAELSFEAPEPGHLSEILINEGETTGVGKPMAIMKYQEDETKL